ncbi:MAG TPA: PHB depolymerase family esterase, partial [Tepidisphaeraceae bacterium]|nr:PHB depolymerase family esterase [Tepidisphaeraceae bacterium]
YDISPNRIFISGASGGGRVSSMLGVCYPDIFKGGMYIIGCNYYREMAAPNAGGQVWRRGYAPPPGEILIQAKKNVSHVLLTGEKDGNREQTKIYYENGFKKDGFLHVTYLEVPGMGHQPPNSEWFERGLAAMEDLKTTGVVAATLPAGGAASVASGGDDSAANGALKAARELAGKDVVAGHGAFLEVARKYSKSGVAKMALEEADKLMGNAENRKRIESAAEADKLLRVARVYAENKLWREARSRLEKILADFPDAPAAKEAKELLRQIGPG